MGRRKLRLSDELRAFAESHGRSPEADFAAMQAGELTIGRIYKQAEQAGTLYAGDWRGYAHALAISAGLRSDAARNRRPVANAFRHRRRLEVTLDPETLRMLDAMATETGRSRSEIVDDAVRAYEASRAWRAGG